MWGAELRRDGAPLSNKHHRAEKGKTKGLVEKTAANCQLRVGRRAGKSYIKYEQLSLGDVDEAMSVFWSKNGPKKKGSKTAKTVNYGSKRVKNGVKGGQKRFKSHLDLHKSV